MNREVHVRIWERPEVRALRATRHQHEWWSVRRRAASPWTAEGPVDELAGGCLGYRHTSFAARTREYPRACGAAPRIPNLTITCSPSEFVQTYWSLLRRSSQAVETIRRSGR